MPGGWEVTWSGLVMSQVAPDQVSSWSTAAVAVKAWLLSEWHMATLNILRRSELTDYQCIFYLSHEWILNRCCKMQLHYLYKRPVASATSLGGEVVPIISIINISVFPRPLRIFNVPNHNVPCGLLCCLWLGALCRPGEKGADMNVKDVSNGIWFPGEGERSRLGDFKRCEATIAGGSLSLSLFILSRPPSPF